jgi:hypothetical protein
MAIESFRNCALVNFFLGCTLVLGFAVLGVFWAETDVTQKIRKSM